MNRVVDRITDGEREDGRGKGYKRGEREGWSQRPGN